ncbi:hypothetical protein [Megamonas hypermegale]|uniref:hypothetical protein n=1 Tax=Megamonas hypermegale TaxID=158847 RepID=UPI00195738A0|nr:hypothetical protein [Megamonas hypermegale]MBM6762141.1 hypothetical protein [Megamonas hypermegale]MBM6833848.1 hypothetical protein [Megamonas hypermegale]
MSDIKNRINELCNAFVFEYNNKLCGIDPLNRNKFNMWYGENDVMTAKNIDEVMQTPFFNGMSLTNLIEKKLINEKNIVSY